MAPAVQLLLASASPRRSELLQQIGVTFERLQAECEEIHRPQESAEDYVCRVALDKARAGYQLVADRGLPVLGADTAVIVDHHILGKPRDQQHAAEMMRLLSAREHRVLSAVAMVSAQQEKVILQESRVRMRRISEKEMQDYWRSGEPQGKAGGYAVQGLGAIFIEHIAGSYSGIMGLPIYETVQLLQTFGVDVLSKR